MAEMDEALKQMAKGPEEFAAAVRGVSDAVLSKRPDEKNWAAKEIICHLRDTEELFISRLQMIMAMDEPKFLASDVDRWAEERQYLRNDVQEALAAFRKRREETVKFLGDLKPEQWRRAGVHATRGRETTEVFLKIIPGHDANHLAQLKRALAGKP
ncbi:MAG TPA: DinB family protein [Thermodesulfobacteriota bacterium]|nr:DinB family protein [Thermodesulfobacteriota bacterium]